jgi:arginase family enzyme
VLATHYGFDAAGHADRRIGRRHLSGARHARQVSLIGAPTDIGAGARGASMGPEALRVAGLQATLEATACR